MAPKTPQQIALDILDRLIDLEAQRLAMAGILIHAKTQDRKPLDWRTDVKHACEPLGTARDAAQQNLAKLREQIQSFDADSIQGLATLAEVPFVPIWEYPKQTSVES